LDDTFFLDGVDFFNGTVSELELPPKQTKTSTKKLELFLRREHHLPTMRFQSGYIALTTLLGLTAKTTTTVFLSGLVRSTSAAEDAADSGGKSSSSTSSPPPFFLIDTSDQLCLAGEEFKRCSIDTLFFVVGSPGT
jgi:hypothetical protein